MSAFARKADIRHKGLVSVPPLVSIPDDLAGYARQAERAFQGGAVPLPDRSGRFIGAYQKVHERLLGVVGGAHHVVGQIVLVQVLVPESLRRAYRRRSETRR